MAVVSHKIPAQYRVPDFRPAPDYAPLLPSPRAKRWGFLIGASAIGDMLAPFHETRPWLSTPWRDRAYLASDFWQVLRRVEEDFPDHPVQDHLFDPDKLNGYARWR